MKQFLSTAAAFAAVVSFAHADLCANGHTNDDGNYYCQEVKGIVYTGVGGSGSYNKITAMGSNGVCSSTPHGYSGTLSPLDEEVSFHVRGPVHMTNFAVYLPEASSSKKHRRDVHRHGHSHLHHNKQVRDAQEAAEKRDAGGDIVYATIDGKLASWTNDYFGPGGASTSAAATSATSVAAAAATTAAEASTTHAAASSSAAAASTAASSSYASSYSGSGSGSSGSWSRNSYYSSGSQTADNLVFLNHDGGQGSGCFDYTYGNSLSYASSDGCTGTSEKTTLADTTLGSNVEVVLMTAQECTGDSCGFSRDDTVAYHGWEGASKAFFFEFEMPLDPDNNDPALNGNMPSIWILNAQIPRTLQYGNAECSCWTSGCGEFDIFEVLAPGDLRAKSTLHGNVNGGDSDYFARPTSSLITVATIFYNDEIHIKVLDSFDFGSTVSSSSIQEIVDLTSTQSSVVSVFKLAS